MSVIALLSLLALSFANPVPQAASKAASNNAALIGQVHSDVLQFLQTHQPIDQADADRQDDFFVNQTQRLESIPTLQQQLGKKHSWACAPWRTNPLPSLVWCMQAEADLGLMEWHEGTVFQQQDPATGRCQPGVGACLPLVFGEGDCQIVLDFYDEEEKTETSSELHIEEMVLWEILKCQAWRWKADPWKTGGTISSGDKNRLKVSIEYQDPSLGSRRPVVKPPPVQYV